MTKYLDVSALACWLGTPTGITRVEAELARHAPADVEFVVFDYARNTYRPIVRALRGALTGTHAALDPAELNPPVARPGWKRFTPSLMSVFMGLERARHRFPRLRRFLGAAQAALLRARRAELVIFDAAGRRFDLYSAAEALGPPITLGPDDRILASVADWSRRDAASFRRYIEASGASFVPICYDLIPVTQPEFFPPDVARAFGEFWSTLLPVARTVVVTAGCVANDIRAFAARLAFRCPEIEIRTLGADLPLTRLAPLPEELDGKPFALFVSTIEPRKNHAMLLRVWRRLCERGWPQAGGYRLVFVGRPGWMVEETLRDLEDRDRYSGTVLHYRSADDALLGRLYAASAFCLYPSRNEGFGLPVVEGFSYGKAVIASTGGALPEVVDGCSPLLDPDDEDAWERLIVAWFEAPETRLPHERRIAERHALFPSRHDWSVVAAGLFSAAGMTD